MVNLLVVTVSVVGLLSVITFILCRNAGLRVSHATVCIVLGFYLASSSFAEPISEVTQGLLDVIQSSS